MKNWLDYVVFENKEDYLQNTEYHTPFYRMFNDGDIREPKEYPACFKLNPNPHYYVNHYSNEVRGEWEPCESQEMINAWKNYLQERMYFIKEVEKILQQENQKFYIFVDAERNLDINQDILDPNMSVIISRTYDETIEILAWCQNKGIKPYLDLDYRLGYDICNYIVENRIPLLGYHLHTTDPVGRRIMNQWLSRFGYSQF